MRKNILSILMASFFFMSADAQAGCIEDSCCVDGTDFYAKIWGGANFLQDAANATYKTGYVVSGSLGYTWCYGLSLEGEYAYRRNAVNKIHFYGQGSSSHGHFQTSSFMANLLWDMPLASWGCSCWDIQPYLGVGIGYDRQQLHSTNSRIVYDQKWNRFSWQLMAGLAYPIFCNTDLTLDYKFHQGGCKFDNHSIGVGLVYKFGF